MRRQKAPLLQCVDSAMLNPRLSALRRSGGEDQSRRVRIEASALMQTKTHVSMSLQSHFAAHGHCTARQSRSVFAAAKGVPMTRPVTPVHPTGQAPCQPIAKRHAAMEPLACKDQMRTQAPCKNGIQPLRTSLRVQVCNAGRRLHAAGVRSRRAAETRERACNAHSDGQRRTFIT